MTATRITVDNTTYRVLVEYDTLKRSFELMEGDNQGTAISGRTIRDILGTNYTYTMTVRADPDYPSDYDAFYWKISEPVDYHQIVIPCGGNEYSTSIWERGALSASTGANSSTSSTIRIRTTTYLDSAIKNVTSLHGYQYCLAVYSNDPTNGIAYQGMWTGSAIQKTTTWLSGEVNLSNIGDYKYRLVLRNPTNTDISLNEGQNMMLDVGAVAFEAKILSGDDVYKGYYMNHKYWDELEVTFEPMAPQRLDIDGPDLSKMVYDKF